MNGKRVYGLAGLVKSNRSRGKISPLKHVDMSLPADHSHSDEAVADPKADFEKLEKERKEFDEAYEKRSLVGKLLGQTPEQDKERYEKTEDVKDKSQIGASFAGVGNPYFDIGNAAASFGRSIDATIGLNRPRSFSDAVKHLKGAAYNTAAVLNVVPPAGGKAFDFIKGGKDLGKSLTFQGDKASDVIRSLGNLGYWFDRDTGTLGGVASQIEGKDKTKK
tara:strand:+ start:519 stop:1178 length:660 start_codon:yes stop_codon:yes gene_type:complete